MRIVLPLAAMILSTGASAPQSREVLPGGPVLRTEPQTAVCRDRIHEARRDLGKPELDNHAPTQDPLFITALDKRINGCSVLVMRNDTSDLRPLPGPAEHRLMPAR